MPPEPLPLPEDVQDFSLSFWGSGLYIDQARAFFNALPLPYTAPVSPAAAERAEGDRRHFSLFRCFGHHEALEEATQPPDTLPEVLTRPFLRTGRCRPAAS